LASFEKHVNVAVIASGVLIVPFYTSTLINTQETFILLALALSGGILPDLDSDSSKPVQIVFKILSVFFPLVVLLSLSIKLPVLQLLLLWVALGIFLQFSFSEFFLKQTTHRGVFHSIPMGVLFAQLSLLLLFYVLEFSLLFSTLAALFLLFGFITHLLLDELSSINALGLHIKKSFGSAFKLYDKHNILGTTILYLVVILLFFYIPMDLDIYTIIVDTFLAISFL